MSKIIKRKIDSIDASKFKILTEFNKIYTDFSIIPNNELEEITIFSFKNKKVKAVRINEQLCMNLKQISNYLNKPYSTIKTNFQKFIQDKPEMYFDGGTTFSSLPPDAKFITFEGIIIMLAHLRGADVFIEEFAKYLSHSINPQTLEQISYFEKNKEYVKLLEDMRNNYDKTNSFLERFVFGLIWEDFNFEVNKWVTYNNEKFCIDIAFNDIKLAIELDGWKYHSEKKDVEYDKRRTQILSRNGWKVIRYTYDQIISYERDDFVNEIKRQREVLL